LLYICARFDKGMFGGFTGRLGNVVGYTLNGKPVARTIGTITKPPTIPQMAVRQRMGLVTKVLSNMLGFINVGFELAVIGTSRNPYNEATSDNFKLATIGEYPDITLDYSKLLVSKGNLPPAENAVVNILPDGIEFTWTVPADIDWNSYNDRSMLLIYYPESGEMIYILSGAQRRECRDFIPLAPSYLDKPIQIYIAFGSDDKKCVSNSVWVENTTG